MALTFDMKNYMTVTHSLGYYEDDENGTIYQFAVEKIEEGGDTEYVINWNDDTPENWDEIEEQIKNELEE